MNTRWALGSATVVGLVFALTISTISTASADGPNRARAASSGPAATLAGPAIPVNDVPAVSAATRFGTTVATTGELGRAASRQRVKYGALGIARLFYPRLPADWADIEAAVGSTPVSISFKLMPRAVLSGSYDAQLKRWFSSAPTDVPIYWTYWHEPEDNIAAGKFSATAYRAAWTRISAIARAVKRTTGARLRPTLVLMCWTASPKSGRDWTNYYPAGSVRLLGWDCYNYAAVDGSYVPASELFENVDDISVATGLPWAVSELGSIVVGDDDGTGRAAWLTETCDYLRANDARFVTYFDTKLNVDYRLNDASSIKAWSECQAA